MQKNGKIWPFFEPTLHVHGTRAVRVENCRQIVEYNEALVRLRAGALEVAVWGTGLRVQDAPDCGIEINGRIASIELREVRG